MIKDLEAALGYKFQNITLLQNALTHSSYSNETGARNHHLLCNERLEFLGDSVLSLITSEYLYSTFQMLQAMGTHWETRQMSQFAANTV